MSVNVRAGKFEEVRPLTSAAKRERVTMENPEGAAWFVAEEDGIIIGCVCVVIKKTGARLRATSSCRPTGSRRLPGSVQDERGLRAAIPGETVDGILHPQSIKVYLEHKFEKVSLHRDIWFVKRGFKGGK